jgi:hypothetical protein
MFHLSALTTRAGWVYCLCTTFFVMCLALLNFDRFLRQNPPSSRKARYSYSYSAAPDSPSLTPSAAAAAAGYRGRFLFYVCIVVASVTSCAMYAMLVLLAKPNDAEGVSNRYSACFENAAVRPFAYYFNAFGLAVGSWCDTCIPLSVEYLYAKTLHAGHFVGKTLALRRENFLRAACRGLASSLWAIVYILDFLDTSYVYRHTPAAVSSSGCVDASIIAPFSHIFAPLFAIALVFYSCYLVVSLSLLFYRSHRAASVADRFFSARKTHLRHLQLVAAMNIALLISIVIFRLLFYPTSAAPFAISSVPLYYACNSTLLCFFLAVNSAAFVSQSSQPVVLPLDKEMTLTVSPLHASTVLHALDESAPVDLTHV